MNADNKGMDHAAPKTKRRAHNRDDAKRAKLVELWQAGLDPKAIAAEIGSTPRAVTTMACNLRKEGVDLPYGNRAPLSRDELRRRLDLAIASGERSGRGNEQRVRILVLKLQGKTDSQIAAQLKIRTTTVRNAISDPDGSKRHYHRATPDFRCVDCKRRVVNYFRTATPRCRVCAAKRANPGIWNEAALIAWMRQEARRRGRTPSLSQVKRGEAPFSASILPHVLGNNAWRKLCERSGLVARPVGGWSPNRDDGTDLTAAQLRELQEAAS